jgi:tetratricopeptide (TPR) repeat protein
MHLPRIQVGPPRSRCCAVFLAIFICGIAGGLSIAQVPKIPTTAESPTTAAERGITLGTKGDCKEAMPILKKVIPIIEGRIRGESAPRQKDDKDLLHDAVMARAQCGMATDQRDVVDESLVILRREFPGDSKVLLITTRYYSELANRTAQELLQKAPSSPEAETLIAEAFQAQGKWDDAAAQYRKILEQSPNQQGIHYQLGRILLSKPMDPTVTEEARKEFEAELKINPTSPSAEFMLGDMALRNQKTDEAIEHFSRAMQFDAGLSEAYLGLGMAFNAAGKYSDAIAPLKKYMEMDRSDPAGYYQLATAYARTGNKPEADRLLALQRQLEKDKPRVVSPPPQDISQPH